jgi:hypothetical protein
VIRLVTPDNESLIGARRRIDFEVEDSHLAAVTVRADGEAFRPFPAPYDVVLEDLLPQGIEPDQGPHTIRVEAVDAVGNIATAFATLTLDSIAPTVLEGTPTGTTSADPVVRARFSEPVNRTSVEAAFSISDGTRTWTAAEGTFAWEADGQAFVFVPAWTPAMDRRHEVRLAASLTDLAGNPLGADAVWLFTPGGVGAPPFVVSMVLLAGALLVAALLAYRRRKRASPPE